MRIHYRVSGEGIEIVRCFGTDSQVVIPEQIEGKPVIKAAPYAFSARKDKEEIDVQKQLYKEQPFVLGVDSGEIYPDTECRAQLLVQGIIDVYFEEEDGLVVLDYKTDRVRTADELVRRYQSQLTYYARALSQITGKAVKEKIIYSFALGKEINV